MPGHPSHFEIQLPDTPPVRRFRGDIDVLVDLDPQRPMGVFEYARLKLDIGDMLKGAAEVVNRKILRLLPKRRDPARRRECLLRNPAQQLRDIIENIDAIQAFIAAFTFQDFVKDRKTVYAVTRALEIISEATRRLVAVAAAGDVYRHGYEVVDEALPWHPIHQDLVQWREISAIELITRDHS